MKILYHQRTAAEDGQAVHIRALQNAFRALGHEVSEVGLVRQGGGPGKAGRSRWGWLAHAPAPARELLEYAYGFSARRRIGAEARHFEPDFLYERYAFGNLGGVLAAADLRLPLVLEVNSPMVLELERTRGLCFKRLARRIEHEVLARADLVCAVSGVLGRMLIGLGARPERLLVTPNGVWLERYAFPATTADAARARAALGLAGLSPDSLVLGFVGYYRDWHRLDLAVAALARPALLQAHLVLVGEGPARASIAAAARQAGAEARVHFAGPVGHERIPELLPAFDVALVPAINAYASPLKLHEYMAAGLALVAPDQENLREVLQHERNGLLFAKDDARALAEALERLAGDPVLRERLGAGARASVESRDLTWTGNARRVVAAVQALR